MSATIARVEVVPVAGHDSMLLNLSGAHGPFFTRNIAIVTDSEGREGVGEVPGGEARARELVGRFELGRVPREAIVFEPATFSAPPSR